MDTGCSGNGASTPKCRVFPLEAVHVSSPGIADLARQWLVRPMQELGEQCRSYWFMPWEGRNSSLFVNCR